MINFSASLLENKNPHSRLFNPLILYVRHSKQICKENLTRSYVLVYNFLRYLYIFTVSLLSLLSVSYLMFFFLSFFVYLGCLWTFCPCFLSLLLSVHSKVIVILMKENTSLFLFLLSLILSCLSFSPLSRSLFSLSFSYWGLF